jgi:hypothetical protein
MKCRPMVVCINEAKWVVETGGREYALCEEHAVGMLIYMWHGPHPVALHFYRIDCEGSYVKDMIARLSKAELKDETLLSVR